MRVSVATERNKARQQLGFSMSEEDGANTTVFVGGLDPGTSEEELRTRFGALGEIVSVKVPPGRGCGFVQYTTKEAAEAAISQMNGSVVGGVKVRCAWGRSAAARYQQGTYGYAAYGQYAQQGTQSQGGYQHQQRQQDQQPDFTRPDDIEAMNRRFASQRAYQNMPPAPNAAYTPMAADVANGTAMAGSI
ncbi:putative RNA recognition motif domain, nucleotide-binding alpha-beta plait domain superfamily [Plasmopara halstedii]